MRTWILIYVWVVLVAHLALGTIAETEANVTISDFVQVLIIYERLDDYDDLLVDFRSALNDSDDSSSSYKKLSDPTYYGASGSNMSLNISEQSSCTWPCSTQSWEAIAWGTDDYRGTYLIYWTVNNCNLNDSCIAIEDIITSLEFHIKVVQTINLAGMQLALNVTLMGPLDPYGSGNNITIQYGLPSFLVQRYGFALRFVWVCFNMNYSDTSPITSCENNPSTMTQLLIFDGYTDVPGFTGSVDFGFQEVDVETGNPYGLFQINAKPLTLYARQFRVDVGVIVDSNKSPGKQSCAYMQCPIIFAPFIEDER